MKNLFIILFVFCITVGYAQIGKSEYNFLKTEIPEERVFLNTNTDLLLSGEYLRYKLTAFDAKTNTFSYISKLGYIELIDAEGSMIFKHKITMENGVGYGDFFVPSSLKTGTYKLLAYTNWSLNNTTNKAFVTSLFIINPFDKETLKATNSTLTEVKLSSPQKNTTEFSSCIELGKTQYNTREKAFITYKPIPALKNSNVSISVRKMDSVTVTNKSVSEKAKTQSNIFTLPEVRGEIIYGHITNSKSGDVSNKIVSLSSPGKSFSFLNTSTDVNGQFKFILEPEYFNTEYIFQVQDEDPSSYTINLDPKSYLDYSSLTFNKLVLNSDIEEWLKQKSITNQIENAYFEIKRDSIILPPSKSSFYNTATTTFMLDDYTRFPSVRETFVEIVGAASITRKGDNYEFQVSDLADLQFNQLLDIKMPLVLVDGVLIQDNSSIVNYGAFNIESISVASGHYVYGPKIYNGLIAFVTKNGDFSENTSINNSLKTELPQPLDKKHYYQPNYSLEDLSRIPDYRSQLLWGPNFSATNDKTFEFFTSDNTGLYEVSIKGFNAAGDTVEATAYFTVN